MQKPTTGRVVHFRISAKQAEAINRRRTTGGSIAERLQFDKWPAGAQAHIGNHASEGDVYPMHITRVWPEEYAGNAYLSHHEPSQRYESAYGVNGQVLLDGNDSFWVTSAPQHEKLTGCWFWPPRE